MDCIKICLKKIIEMNVRCEKKEIENYREKESIDLDVVKRILNK